MEKLRLSSVMPPAAFKGQNNIYYLVVDNGKSVDYIEINKNYNWRDEFIWNRNQINIIDEPVITTKTIKSKSTDKEYVVSCTIYSSGQEKYSCSCPGATYRNKCKHIDEFKQERK